MRKLNLSQWYGHDLDVVGRTIWMGSCSDHRGIETGTDYAMAERMIKGLYVLDSISHRPINVIMNNTGGDVYHGLAIYDAIKATTSKVNITVFGHAFSMGSIILQAAHRRIMMPSATMMIHIGTESGETMHAEDFKRLAFEGGRLDRIVKDIYLERFKETEKELDQLLAYDTYLNAESAVIFGLADSVFKKEKK